MRTLPDTSTPTGPLGRLLPRVSADAVTGFVSGCLFLGTGAAVLASTLLPSSTPFRDLPVVRLVNVFAVLAGLVLVLVPRRRGWIPHLATIGGVLLITTALCGSGGGGSAIAYASVYSLAPAYAFLSVSPRAATFHLALTLLVGAPALALQPGVEGAEEVVVWAVVVLLGVVSGTLAHALREAETDTLTGLVNRRGLERSLQEEIATSAPGSTSFALLDLDHFRAFNEDRGRPAGDRLLQGVVAAWLPLVPPGAILGRFTADEFALVLPGTDSRAAADLVDRLRAEVIASSTCSAGVAQHEQGESASMLVARADSAVYGAKRAGRSRTHQHLGSGTEGIELREALARREFVVYFQPIVELSTRRTIAAEALVRWEHPERGLLGPMEFLPDAEQSGVIIDLGAWILGEACRQAASWVPIDGALPYVTVNASGQELQDPTYVDTVEEALRVSGLPAARLVLELVESHYDIESLHLASNLHRLRVLGVRTAMDDFGVGYSSLDRLRRAGVDILKIDRSFVTDIVSPDQDAPLVAAIIAMARALRLRVVAEGVETEEQAQWLRAHECDSIQGWLMGRPRPHLQAVEHAAVMDDVNR